MSHHGLSPDRIRRLEGFGQTAHADGYLYRPSRVEEIHEALDGARVSGRQVVLRGAGRSYGDASVAAESVILDLGRMNQVLAWDSNDGRITVEAGATFEGMWRHILEDGYWLPVVSGTMYPTIAGALAMNIHGKNNFQAGTLGEHVESIDVLFPYGEERTLTPEHPFFHAVISGAGLLGVITRATLRMKKVSSGDLRVLPISCRNWDEQFAAFESLEADADYLVSWIDGLAHGDQAGRGLFHAAWHEDGDSPSSTSLSPSQQDLPDTILGLLPKSVVWRFLKPLNNRFGMRVLNAAKYRSSRLLGNGKPIHESLVAFTFLLDYVPNWRRAYGRGGFIQYQTFLPKETAQAVFAQQLAMARQAGLPPFLAVLKRHRPDPFLFSHGVDGYSLALDFKRTERRAADLTVLAHRMNDLVLQSGGRFYLAKDSTLRAEDFRRSLPDGTLDKYFGIKKQVDPDSLLTSQLAKRLELDPR